jgi:hypothetical protein
MGSSYGRHGGEEECIWAFSAKDKRPLGRPRHRWEDTAKSQSNVPGSIVQFLGSLNKAYLNYQNKTRNNRSSIHRYPACIGQNV